MKYLAEIFIEHIIDNCSNFFYRNLRHIDKDLQVFHIHVNILEITSTHIYAMFNPYTIMICIYLKKIVFYFTGTVVWRIGRHTELWLLSMMQI